MQAHDGARHQRLVDDIAGADCTIHALALQMDLAVMEADVQLQRRVAAIEIRQARQDPGATKGDGHVHFQGAARLAALRR
ncbi:hypothetical protein D9M68_903450 [compost metagenome]